MERVSISNLPRSGEAATGSRRSANVELPPRWLERLLDLWTDLPIAAGERAVVLTVVDALAAMMPDHAVAVCLVPAGGGPQEVVRSAAAGPVFAGSDPTRLFPGHAYERVTDIDALGSTLHVAGEDAACEDESSPSSGLLLRTAAVARSGLEVARMQARAHAAVEEARSLNAQIVQAEKLSSLGQIAAGVVHELNNPLTSIVAYTDYLVRKAEARATGPDGDEIHRLRRISESAGRMLRFTRDLVSYARPSSEAPVPVCLNQVINQSLAFCEHVIADAQVIVERRFDDALPLVRGKPEQLAQIFVNLVTNACHAMTPGGGSLIVTTGVEDGHVRVDLADTGHGIAAPHLNQVFTPFFTTKSSGAGTGLGLAIVKSIVDGHNGTIRVESVPGQGATFTIDLPVDPTAAE